MPPRPQLAPDEQMTIEELLAFTASRPDEERWARQCRWPMSVAGRSWDTVNISPRFAARIFVALAVLVLGTLVVRADSSKDDWFSDSCAEKAPQRWCAPLLRQGGWALKYKTESPKDLQDVAWLIEVWVKGADALVCEFKTGRGGVRSNGCYSLTEVR